MNDITKLPKWAQDKIAMLERERETAIDTLNRWQDGQAKSPIANPNYECTGENIGPTMKTQYIQSHRLEITWQGIKLQVLLRDKAIDLQYSGAGAMQSDVCLVPRSYQQIWLVVKENMR